jgi:hypothetical protein
MSETQFKFKNPITVKLTKPEEDEIDNLLQEALPDYDFENFTGRSLFMALVENAIMKTRRKNEPRPADTASIQNLTIENGQLKNSIELLNKEIYKLDKMYSEKTQLAITLETELNGKIDEVENIKTAVPDPKAIVLMFPEKGKTLLNLACSRIAQRTKQEVTPDLLLWDLFWDYVRGIADHKYPFVIKSSDLKETKHE